MDIETYSDHELGKCGVYKYTDSLHFQILLFGYSIDGGDAKAIDRANGETVPAEIKDALLNDEITKWAHNAQFERICLSKWLGLPAGMYLDPKPWRCTMVWSAYLGLPLSLAGIGAILGLDRRKIEGGKDLIRYFCGPCKPTKANGGRTRNLPSNDPDKWAEFKAYNIRDVEVELAIQKRLEKFPVLDQEWQNYILDQEINDQGILLDMNLVRQAISLDGRARVELMEAMQGLTNLENPNSVAQLKTWLAKQGFQADSLDKVAIIELMPVVPETAKRVLEIRQSLAKASVRKYTAMENVVCSDGRARGLIQFHGANRTGRYSGRLIQVQNLPRNNLPDLKEARALVKAAAMK